MPVAQEDDEDVFNANDPLVAYLKSCNIDDVNVERGPTSRVTNELNIIHKELRSDKYKKCIESILKSELLFEDDISEIQLNSLAPSPKERGKFADNAFPYSAVSFIILGACELFGRSIITETVLFINGIFISKHVYSLTKIFYLNYKLHVMINLMKIFSSTARKCIVQFEKFASFINDHKNSTNSSLQTSLANAKNELFSALIESFVTVSTVFNKPVVDYLIDKQICKKTLRNHHEIYILTQSQFLKALAYSLSASDVNIFEVNNEVLRTTITLRKCIGNLNHYYNFLKKFVPGAEKKPEAPKKFVVNESDSLVDSALMHLQLACSKCLDLQQQIEGKPKIEDLNEAREVDSLIDNVRQHLTLSNELLGRLQVFINKKDQQGGDFVKCAPKKDDNRAAKLIPADYCPEEQTEDVKVFELKGNRFEEDCESETSEVAFEERCNYETATVSSLLKELKIVLVARNPEIAEQLGKDIIELENQKQEVETREIRRPVNEAVSMSFRELFNTAVQKQQFEEEFISGDCDEESFS